MQQKTKNDRNQGSNAKKKYFCLVPKSPTQMGSLSAKNASKKFSPLGTFKETADCLVGNPIYFLLRAADNLLKNPVNFFLEIIHNLVENPIHLLQ
jgi:hypothetical protein